MMVSSFYVTSTSTTAAGGGATGGGATTSSSSSSSSSSREGRSIDTTTTSADTTTVRVDASARSRHYQHSSSVSAFHRYIVILLLLALVLAMQQVLPFSASPSTLSLSLLPWLLSPFALLSSSSSCFSSSTTTMIAVVASTAAASSATAATGTVVEEEEKEKSQKILFQGRMVAARAGAGVKPPGSGVAAQEYIRRTQRMELEEEDQTLGDLSRMSVLDATDKLELEERDHSYMHHHHHPHLRHHTSSMRKSNAVKPNQKATEQEQPANVDDGRIGVKSQQVMTDHVIAGKEDIPVASSYSRLISSTFTNTIYGDDTQCKIDKGIDTIAHVLQGAFTVVDKQDDGTSTNLENTPALKISRNLYRKLKKEEQEDVDGILYAMKEGSGAVTLAKDMLAIFRIAVESNEDWFLENQLKEYVEEYKKIKKFMDKGHDNDAQSSLAEYMGQIISTFKESVNACFDKHFPLCRDNSDFLYNDEIAFFSRNCNQIGLLDNPDRLKLCKIEQISANCLLTCGKCCEDDATFKLVTFGTKSYRSCSWLTGDRVGKYCHSETDSGSNGNSSKQKVLHFCPKSCNACFSGFLNQGAVMTADTTVPYDILSLQNNWTQENIEWNVSLISRYTTITYEFPPEKCFRGLEEKDSMNNYIMSFFSKPDVTADFGETYLNVQLDIESYDLPSACIADTKIKITFPRSAYTFCIRDKCNPILCPITAESSSKCISQMLNFVPANTVELFGSNKNCSIVKPEKWKDWVAHHFPYVKNDAKFDSSFYYADNDGDCVSNIIEYHGLDLTKLYVDSFGSEKVTSNGGIQTSIALGNITDPNNPDTDGDGLSDGYEFLFGSPPNIKHNNMVLDSDSDGIPNFYETIMPLSSLYSADSDFDGFNDQDERYAGTDPMDAASVPHSNNQNQLNVTVKLMVGDESGSNSERWKLHVGDKTIFSPFYGILFTEIHTYREGDYEITLEHFDSRLPTPDYDYTALVEFEDDPNFYISITDESELLGKHIGHGIGNDRTIGKSATLHIRRKGAGSNCHLSTNCASCNSDTGCSWDQAFKICRPFNASSPFYKELSRDCACERCRAWASANHNVTWIEQLPRCPCTVREYSIGSFSWLGLTYKQKMQYINITWVTDMACNPTWGCSDRPDAKGCILSARSDLFPGGQHCCYDKQLNLIHHGDRSAGTPHKSHFSSVLQHWSDDLKPFHSCCSDCETDAMCDLYKGELGGKQGMRSDPHPCLKAP